MVSNLSFFNPFLFLLEFENKLQCLLYYSFFLTLSLSIITLISYIKIEKFKDIERINFFSDLQSSDLPTNAMVSDDDMSLIKKDYIRASAQYKQGQKGTQKDKARMFYEHYKSCKKVMDQLRASLKNKKK